MKCPHCGAEVTGDVCEYCGSHIENTKPNSPCCPHCGSRRVSFTRERDSWYNYRTVGVCQDCGRSWDNTRTGMSEFNPQILLWLFGWVLCFPIPLSILILRIKSIPMAARYLLIAALWILVTMPYVLPWLDMMLF